MPLLRIKIPGQTERAHVLQGARVTVGRRPENVVQILDPSVSGFHAEFVASDGHYRLHDLESTNLCFVDGMPVSDFHLHQFCTITFGGVECAYDPAAAAAALPPAPAPLQREIAFLISENAELQGQVNALQRRLDILSSARLVTGRTETAPFTAAHDALRALTSERDDLRHLAAALQLELAQVREELADLRSMPNGANSRGAQTPSDRIASSASLVSPAALAAGLPIHPSDFTVAAIAGLPIPNLAETQKLTVGPPPPR